MRLLYILFGFFILIMSCIGGSCKGSESIYKKPMMKAGIKEKKDAKVKKLDKVSDITSRKTDDMIFIQNDEGGFYIDKYEYPNRKSAIPSFGITFLEAKDVCRSMGKRLCTSYEWRLACSGRVDKTNSHNSDKKPDRSPCNSVRESKKIAPSGEFKDCRSDFGVYDLVGNLWEWVEMSEDGIYVVKGGSFREGVRPISCDLELRLFPLQIEKMDLSTFGFRCCR